MRPQGSPVALEQRRRRAVTLLSHGYQPHEVAQMLGVDRRSVRRWKRAHGCRALKGCGRGTRRGGHRS